MNRRGEDRGLVISNRIFNEHSGMSLICPVTNTDRDIPFHKPVPSGCGITGVVMVDQVKSVDYRARKFSSWRKLRRSF